MAGHSKTVFGRNTFQHFSDDFVRELDHLTAFLADQMVVVWVPVVMLINFPVVGSRDLTDQSGFFATPTSAGRSRRSLIIQPDCISCTIVPGSWSEGISIIA